MSDTLIERLRDHGHITQRDGLSALIVTCEQAADTIDHHKARADRAEAALREARDALDAAHYYIDEHANAHALYIARVSRAALEPKP